MVPEEKSDDCGEHGWLLDELDLASRHADQGFQCAWCAAVRVEPSAPGRA